MRLPLQLLWSNALFSATCIEGLTSSPFITVSNCTSNLSVGILQVLDALLTKERKPEEITDGQLVSIVSVLHTRLLSNSLLSKVCTVCFVPLLGPE